MDVDKCVCGRGPTPSYICSLVIKKTHYWFMLYSGAARKKALEGRIAWADYMALKGWLNSKDGDFCPACQPAVATPAHLHLRVPQFRHPRTYHFSNVKSAATLSPWTLKYHPALRRYGLRTRGFPRQVPHQEHPCKAAVPDRLSDLRPPGPNQSVYREDCTQCFDSIVRLIL